MSSSLNVEYNKCSAAVLCCYSNENRLACNLMSYKIICTNVCYKCFKVKVIAKLLNGRMQDIGMCLINSSASLLASTG